MDIERDFDAAMIREAQDYVLQKTYLLLDQIRPEVGLIKLNI